MTQLKFETSQIITAGRTLRGFLKIIATKAVKASHLEVCFSGEEYAIIRHQTGATRVRTYTERRQIVRLDVNTSHINAVVQRNNNTLPLGVYEVPFMIPIPSGLPASMYFGDCNSSTKVAYSLQAELIGSGYIHDYHAQHVVEVRAKPRLVLTIPYSVPPQSHKIVAGGVLFNQGQIAFGAEADDILLVPGQQMNISLAIVNESLASIRKIRVALKERAEWTVSESEYRSTTHTTSRTHQLIDHSWNVRSSPVCKKQDANVWKKTSMSTKGGEKSHRLGRNFQLIEKQLATEDNLITLALPQIPREAHNSYDGTYTKVTHELTVTLETNSVVHSNPKFRIPIRIANHGQKTLLPTTLPVATSVTMKLGEQPEIQEAIVLGIVQ